MMEEMLSHLVFSLYLAHLGLCDNISIDPNKRAWANSIMTEMQLESKAAAFMQLFLQGVSGNEWLPPARPSVFIGASVLTFDPWC